jgi:hypothetical protein
MQTSRVMEAVTNQPSKQSQVRVSASGILPQSFQRQKCKPYSIWKDVDELAFHENNIILELLGRSQGKAPPKLPSHRNPFKSDDHSED